MRSEKEIRDFLSKIKSPEECKFINKAYIWGVIDALRWVLGEYTLPLYEKNEK